jgi:hypothetical protein
MKEHVALVEMELSHGGGECGRGFVFQSGK